jgi:hypothetical protein
MTTRTEKEKNFIESLLDNYRENVGASTPKEKGLLFIDQNNTTTGASITPKETQMLQPNSATPWREETDNLVKTQYESQYGFPIYENEFGTRMSEKSVTIPMNGQFYNFRTIYDGQHFNEDQVKNMFLDGSIKPTSVHKTYDEAINSAKIRSDGIQHMLPKGTYARDDEGTATGEYTANVGRMKQYYDHIDKHGTNLGFTRY